MDMTSHWHVGYGLIGYGPNIDENTSAAHTLLGAATDARDRLSEAADHAMDTARILAMQEDYAGAWTEFTRSEKLATTAQNLDLDTRRRAPLFQSLYRVRGVYEAEVFAYDEDAAAEDFALRVRGTGPDVREVDLTFEVLTDVRSKVIETITSLLDEAPWDVSDNERLYVWECTENECAPREEDS